MRQPVPRFLVGGQFSKQIDSALARDSLPQTLRRPPAFHSEWRPPLYPRGQWPIVARAGVLSNGSCPPMGAAVRRPQWPHMADAIGMQGVRLASTDILPLRHAENRYTGERA